MCVSDDATADKRIVDEASSQPQEEALTAMRRAAGQGAALAFNFASALLTIVANKYALRRFPYPAALTALHYVCSLAAVCALHAGGAFQRGASGPGTRMLDSRPWPRLPSSVATT